MRLRGHEAVEVAVVVGPRSEMPPMRVIFMPNGLDGEIDAGSSVLDAARQLGADLDSVCGGRGICGRCQVTLSTGTFSKWGLTVTDQALSAPGPTELDYGGRRPLAEGQRLGCAAEIVGDVVIDIPAESQIHKQIVRKEVDSSDLVLDPVVELRYVELPPVTLGDNVTVLSLVRAALCNDWDVADLAIDSTALPQLQLAATASTVGLTICLRDGKTIVAAWPGFVDTALGIAVDIGSTTIAGHLCDLTTGEVLGTAGRMNPQIRFGEDLMSRVSYVMMNHSGDRELTQAVRLAVDELVGELVEQVGATRSEILELTMVGNPIMHHLLLGIDPTPLGTAPFLLATDEALELRADRLDIDCPNGRVYIPPCVAGHVGADTAAAIVNEGPHRQAEVQLLVDIGTNAEIVVGNNEQLFAASSPTGPAFEGAQISCGMRAATGAIERVRIDPATLEPRFKVIGSDLWSDDPAFDTPVIGICGSGIIEVMSEMATAGILDRGGVIVDRSVETPRVIASDRTYSYVLHRPENGPELRIEQNDVRAVQLAKAALRAGIELLMEHAGLTAVEDIRLAGAFGSHIDTDHAIKIDLIPPSSGSVRSSGNSAGNGAVGLLLSAKLRRETEAIVATIIKIETATDPRFQDLFVKAMAFPTAPLVEGASSQGRRRRRTTRSNT